MSNRTIALLSTICIITFGGAIAYVGLHAIDKQQAWNEQLAANRCAQGFNAYCYEVARGA